MRIVVDEQELSDRIGCHDFGDERAARELPSCSGSDLQVDFVYLTERPAAGNRRTRPVGLPASLVGDLVPGSEQLQGLVVVIGLEGLLEGDQVRLQLTQASGQRHLAVTPCRMVIAAQLDPADAGFRHRIVTTPQIERGDARAAHARRRSTRCPRTRHRGILAHERKEAIRCLQRSLVREVYRALP